MGLKTVIGLYQAKGTLKDIEIIHSIKSKPYHARLNHRYARAGTLRISM